MGPDWETRADTAHTAPLPSPLAQEQPLQEELYLSWILPLVLQQLLQVNLEGEPALSQVSAQLGHTQQVRLGA